MSVHGVRADTITIPQQVYAVPTAQPNFTPEAPIEFWYNEERGIPLQAALLPGFLQGNDQHAGAGLLDGNKPTPIVHDADKITLRTDVRIINLNVVYALLILR